MRLRQEAIFQRGSEARLADAGLAAEQHDAAFASLRLAPAVQQQCEFVFATEQRCAAAGAQRLETTVDRALAQHAPDPDRLLVALDCRCADIATIEQPADEVPRALVDHHLIRFGEGLQA